MFDTEVEMNAKEAELVNEEFCLREDTYNLCFGGHGGWGYVNQNSLGVSDKQKVIASILMKKINENTPREIYSIRGKIAAAAASKSRKILYPNGTFFGKTHSENTKNLIGQKNSVNQSGKNNSQFGTMWITDGKESIKIKKDHPIPEGWIKGRKI